MYLEQRVQDLLTNLEAGTPVNRAAVISLLRDLKSNLLPPEEQVTECVEGARTFEPRKESTPVRIRVRHWDKGCCKRCGVQGAPDGAYVVKIYGTGWWHDECYRIVNPEFYKGI